MPAGAYYNITIEVTVRVRATDDDPAEAGTRAVSAVILRKPEDPAVSKPIISGLHVSRAEGDL